MTATTHNHRQLVRQYLQQFERRFVQIDGGVVYQRAEGRAGVRLTHEAAASLIAGMRATLDEVDAANPWSGGRIWPYMVAAPMILLMVGAITDFTMTAAALIVPVLLAMWLLGPSLGGMRIHIAWRRGLAEVDRNLADADAVPAEDIPGNPLRAPFFVVMLLAVAVIAGLFFASVTAPDYARAKIDALLGQIIMPLVLVVVGLGWATAFVEARSRRRVSEAAIRDARLRRGNWPLG